MNENSRPVVRSVQGRTASHLHIQSLAIDLDAIAQLGLDRRLTIRLQDARRAALARRGGGFAPSSHWINWAPVGFAMVLVLVTSWSMLVDNAKSLDADLLADALPFDAYLDADFESSIDRGGVELIEN